VFVNKMFFLRRMCITNTNESALIYMVLPAWLVIHRRFCIFLFFFNKKNPFNSSRNNYSSPFKKIKIKNNKYSYSKENNYLHIRFGSCK
jgi:hypothetical protein